VTLSALDTNKHTRHRTTPHPTQPHTTPQVREEGWAPQHVAVRDEAGRLVGCCPLYLKGHSYGEYVFDNSWASFYQMQGKR